MAAIARRPMRLEARTQRGIAHLLESIHTHAPDARMTLLGPSPFDEVTRPMEFPGGYNAALLHFAELDKGLAEKFGGTFINLNPPVVAAIQKAQALDPRIAKLLLPDRVHPDPLAHWVMAEAVLKGWNAPALVSSVTIDARTGTLVRKQERHNRPPGTRKGHAALERNGRRIATAFVAQQREPGTITGDNRHSARVRSRSRCA